MFLYTYKKCVSVVYSMLLIFIQICSNSDGCKFSSLTSASCMWSCLPARLHFGWDRQHASCAYLTDSWLLSYFSCYLNFGRTMNVCTHNIDGWHCLSSWHRCYEVTTQTVKQSLCALQYILSFVFKQTSHTIAQN